MEASAAARAASTASSTAAAIPRVDKPVRRIKVTTKRASTAKTSVVSNSSDSPNSCSFSNNDLLPRNNQMYESVSMVDYASAHHPMTSIYGHTANRHNIFKIDPYEALAFENNNNNGQRQSPCSTASSNLSCATLTPPATPQNTAILGSSSPNKNPLSREPNYASYVASNMVVNNNQRQATDPFVNKFSQQEYYSQYSQMPSHSNFATHADVALNDPLQSFAHTQPLNDGYNNYMQAEYYSDDMSTSGMQSYHDLNAAVDICPTNEKKFIPELMNGGGRLANGTFLPYNDAYAPYQMN